jgi:hypothetical protein
MMRVAEARSNVQNPQLRRSASRSFDDRSNIDPRHLTADPAPDRAQFHGARGTTPVRTDSSRFAVDRRRRDDPPRMKKRGREKFRGHGQFDGNCCSHAEEKRVALLRVGICLHAANMSRKRVPRPARSTDDPIKRHLPGDRMIFRERTLREPRPSVYRSISRRSRCKGGIGRLAGSRLV